MPTCSRCEKNIGLFSFRSYSKQSRRCNKCDDEIQRAVVQFIHAFRKFAEDGVLTAHEWDTLKTGAARDNLEMDEALYYARSDVLRLVSQAVEIAFKDEVISWDEERHINFLLQMLAVPDYYAQDVRARVKEWKEVQRIREGNLPIANTGIYMLPDEICHLELDAVYINTQTKTHPQRAGRLLATNMKLMFSSSKGGFDIDWKKVNSVVRESDTVYIEMALKKGTGFYQTQHPAILEAVISQLVTNAKRETSSRRQRPQPSSPVPSEQKRSPYEILNIPPTAQKEAITTAYRLMAKLYHPDKVATLAPEFKEIAERRMKEINAAYRALR